MARTPCVDEASAHLGTVGPADTSHLGTMDPGQENVRLFSVFVFHLFDINQVLTINLLNGR